MYIYILLLIINLYNYILYFNVINLSFEFIKYFYIIYKVNIIKINIINLWYLDTINLILFKKYYNKLIVSKYHKFIIFIFIMLTLYNFFNKYNVFIREIIYYKNINLFFKYL